MGRTRHREQCTAQRASRGREAALGNICGFTHGTQHPASGAKGIEIEDGPAAVACRDRSACGERSLDSVANRVCARIESSALRVREREGAALKNPPAMHFSPFELAPGYLCSKSTLAAAQENGSFAKCDFHGCVVSLRGGEITPIAGAARVETFSGRRGMQGRSRLAILDVSGCRQRHRVPRHALLAAGNRRGSMPELPGSQESAAAIAARRHLGGRSRLGEPNAAASHAPKGGSRGRLAAGCP